MKRNWRFLAPAAMLVSVGMISLHAQAAAPAAGSDRLVIRAGYGSPLASLTVRGSDGHSLRLPAGLYSPRSHLLLAISSGTPGRVTQLRAISADTGKIGHRLRLAGTFSTSTGDYSLATLSFNGHWLALRSLAPDGNHTDIAVIYTPHLRVVTRLHLAGQFGLDAIGGNGAVLYLTEGLPTQGSEAYDVRSYNLPGRVLDPLPVIEKGETTGTMNGVAQTRAWSAGGDWLFTLYVRPRGAGAFIHSLDLQNRVAHCIFLPDKIVAVDLLAHYTLAVGSGGNALYAVNPPLGRVFAVQRGMAGPVAYGDTGSATMQVQADSPVHAMNGAVVSRDGRSLYVATQRGVWVIGTRKLALRTTYLPGHSISSVVLSRDGRRLYALEPARNVIQILSSAHGVRLGQISIAAGSWAIEQVMN